MSSSNCCFLPCIQVSQESGKLVWYSHFFKNIPQFVVIHTVKVFSIFSEAEVDVFLKLSSFFDDPVDAVNLISGSSAFSKSSLYLLKFLVQVSLKPSLKDLVCYLASMWNKCNCVVVWALSKSIPRYLITFVPMVNEIDSLISLSDFSLLVYRNTSDFCVLIYILQHCKIHWLALVIFWYHL